nr:RNA-directed DNA polymerase, eukaryota [Tanacetum cinerariifolium]
THIKPRSGIEAVQLAKLEDKLEDVQLVNKRDRWAWSLNGLGEFSVASIRRLLDDIRLPEVSSQTRWIKAVPIKVNILAWKVLEGVCYGLWWHLWFFRNKWMFGQDRPSMERLFDDVVEKARSDIDEDRS